jgi:hypothetical protein
MGDGFLLIGPAAAAHVASALQRAEQRHRLDGIRPPALWVTLRNAASASAAFAIESAKVRSSDGMSQSDSIGSGQVGAGRVAEVLGCSPQWARALLRRGDLSTARRVGRTWLVDEDEVAAMAITQAVQDEAAA